MYRSRDNSDIAITVITLILIVVGGIIGFSKCNGGDHKSAERARALHFSPSKL